MAGEIRPFRFMAGVLTSLIGLAVVFMVFGFSTLVEPELQGIAWWLAVSRMMVGPGLFGLTLGLTTLAGGICLIASSGKPRSQVSRGRAATIRLMMLIIAIVALLLAAHVLTPGPTVHSKYESKIGIHE